MCALQYILEIKTFNSLPILSIGSRHVITHNTPVLQLPLSADRLLLPGIALKGAASPPSPSFNLYIQSFWCWLFTISISFWKGHFAMALEEFSFASSYLHFIARAFYQAGGVCVSGERRNMGYRGGWLTFLCCFILDKFQVGREGTLCGWLITIPSFLFGSKRESARGSSILLYDM